MKVKVNWNQWHLKTIEWAISDLLWICESNRRSIRNFTRPWLYLPLPICINCRALAWEGVYVYKLAFFFWLSPRTYHFLFEKRLIIDWWYFWRNIALSLILERSPDYPLNNRDFDDHEGQIGLEPEIKKHTTESNSSTSYFLAKSTTAKSVWAVNVAFTFTTNSTISSPISQTSRFWVAMIPSSPNNCVLFHILYKMPGHAPHVNVLFSGQWTFE